MTVQIFCARIFQIFCLNFVLRLFDAGVATPTSLSRMAIVLVLALSLYSAASVLLRSCLLFSASLNTLCVLYERNLEHNHEAYVCYVDYEKAFDHVDNTN